MQEFCAIEGGIKQRPGGLWWGGRSLTSVQTFTNAVPSKSWWSRNKEKQDLFSHSICLPAFAHLLSVANLLVVGAISLQLSETEIHNSFLILPVKVFPFCKTGSDCVLLCCVFFYSIPYSLAAASARAGSVNVTHPVSIWACPDLKVCECPGQENVLTQWVFQEAVKEEWAMHPIGGNSKSF